MQLNTLTPYNFFGERALITGEPRAASIRTSKPTRCFAFHKDNIPSSSVLSGKQEATEERLRQLDDKYGVDSFDDIMSSQMKTISVANQNRGSVNTPRPILGVDVNDEEGMKGMTPQPTTTPKEDVLSLLVRFRLIRQAARCFEYIMRTQPRWGDQGETRRRSILVSKLSSAQQEEFKNVFKMIDVSGDGTISVLELKKVMESAGSETTEEELYEMINKANPAVDGNTEINFDEFMGVMAEAEFYYLFTDTFNALDKYNSGFVRAADLDRVLCGMRDLISDDRMSIIDVEDKEMLVDYEQFSKMLLGASL
jgi:calmodulin/calcium-binding protein CML